MEIKRLKKSLDKKRKKLESIGVKYEFQVEHADADTWLVISLWSVLIFLSN